MERKLFLKYLIGLSTVGIMCILLFGRPGKQGSDFSWKYTMQPTPRPPIMVQIPQQQQQASLPPVLLPVSSATPVPALTTAPTPFVLSSVVGKPLREAIAEIARQKPDAVIRPLQLGTSAPPSPPNPLRVSVEYDPSTLVVSKVTVG